MTEIKIDKKYYLGKDILDAILAHMDTVAALPAADVVEVVRCKDCKYFNLIDKITEGKYLCDRNKLWQPGQYRPYMSENDYCSYGERKEG